MFGLHKTSAGGLLATVGVAALLLTLADSACAAQAGKGAVDRAKAYDARNGHLLWS